MKLTENQKRRFEKMIAEATTDCHDEEEVFSGWASTLEDNLPLPLKCFVFGEEAVLVGVDMNEGGGAVLGVVQKSKKKARVPIQDIQVKDKTTKSLEWIEAYRYYIGVIR